MLIVSFATSTLLFLCTYLISNPQSSSFKNTVIRKLITIENRQSIISVVIIYHQILAIKKAK